MRKALFVIIFVLIILTGCGSGKEYKEATSIQLFDGGKITNEYTCSTNISIMEARPKNVSYNEYISGITCVVDGEETICDAFNLVNYYYNSDKKIIKYVSQNSYCVRVHVIEEGNEYIQYNIVKEEKIEKYIEVSSNTNVVVQYK